MTSGMALGTRRESVDGRRVTAMIAAVQRVYPGMAGAGVAVPAGAGLRPCSPDGLPYIGPAPGVAGLTVATGHGMLGVSLAAATAARVAESIEAGAQPRDIVELSPARFARVA